MEKIDQILDSLYNRVIEQTEAKEQLLEDVLNYKEVTPNFICNTFD